MHHKPIKRPNEANDSQYGSSQQSADFHDDTLQKTSVAQSDILSGEQIIADGQPDMDISASERQRASSKLKQNTKADNKFLDAKVIDFKGLIDVTL